MKANHCSAAGGNGIQPCGDELYCCYGLGGCDCTNSTQTFQLGPIRAIKSITSQASATATSTSGGSSTSSTSSKTHTPTASQTSTQTPGSTGGSTGGSSNSLGVGLGVGLGLGIPLCLAVIGGLWLLRKSQRRREEAPQNAWQGQQPGGGGISEQKTYPFELQNHPPDQPHELPTRTLS